jgi:bis(5'-nucleosyl)-tetraphosphatase (symmetrical)
MTLYAVGDVQGCAEALDILLERIAFDRRHDHLWLVGDLVNRGPDSRGVLRRIMELGSSATTVLGNHDLHLLATAAGARGSSGGDTFNDVLKSSDADELIDWLRRRPLLVRDRDRRLVLVHAGIPPVWKVGQARRYAAEVEEQLAAASWKKALRGMYGETPAQWSAELPTAERRRFTINALTRMRFCDVSGRLDFKFSGPPGSQPDALRPWFDLPRRGRKKWHIVFGHWSALGMVRREDITALDTGCVWGGELTAVPLDPPGAAVKVACSRCGA